MKKKVEKKAPAIDSKELIIAMEDLERKKELAKNIY